MKKISFKKLDESAKLPTRKHQDDAGIDVYALETFRIAGGEQKVIHTGIALADCPKEHVLLVWPKSGLDAEFGLHTGAGVIDSGFRGEILILLKNMSEFIWEISAGEAIAQIVVVPRPIYVIVEAEEVSETERGETGGIVNSVKKDGNG